MCPQPDISRPIPWQRVELITQHFAVLGIAGQPAHGYAEHRVRPNGSATTSPLRRGRRLLLAEMGEAVTDPGTAALLELVGPVHGRRVLDLACGHGRVTRELIRRGATVTGLDISDALLTRARAAEQVAPLGARYIHGDAAGSVDLPAGSFDSVVCNYGLSDIDDLAGALANVHTLLRPGGAFVFSLLHPCFPGWGNDIASSWPPGHGYFAEGWWRSDARASNLRRRVGANHRTIATYLNQLAAHNLTVQHVLEPLPPQRWRSEHPDADPVPTFLAAHCLRLRAQPHDTILG